MTENPAPRAIIYGVPGAGKSSVASAVAALVGGQHLEMSDHARILYGEHLLSAPGVSYEDFVEYCLWQGGDLAVVARNAFSAWQGGPVMISGPRRLEEVDYLREHFETNCVLEIRTDEDERVRRLGLMGVGEEAAVARRLMEEGWGLVGRSLDDTCIIENSHTLAESVWTSAGLLAEGVWAPDTGNFFDSTELEFRFRVSSEPQVIRAVAKLGDAKIRDLTDEWYIPAHVASFDKHERWVETGLSAPVRIRVGDRRAALTAKSPPSVRGVATEFTYRFEQEQIEQARGFLYRLGLIQAVRLPKRRRQIRDHGTGCVISIDSYEQDCVVEVEFDGATRFAAAPPTRDDARSVLAAIAPGIEFEHVPPVPLTAVRSYLRDLSQT